MLPKILNKIFFGDPKVEEAMDADEKRQMYQAGPKPGAGLPGRNLAGANLYMAYLSGANLSGAYLRNADFSQTILDHVENANFTGALKVPDNYLIGTVRTGRPRSKWEPYDFRDGSRFS